MALDYIGKYRPLFVFLENVAGFLHSQVAEQDQSNFEFLRNQLWDLGYSVILLRVNPLDIGYPQRRRRIFIVGVLSSFMHQDWVCVIWGTKTTLCCMCLFHIVGWGRIGSGPHLLRVHQTSYNRFYFFGFFTISWWLLRCQVWTSTSYTNEGTVYCTWCDPTSIVCAFEFVFVVRWTAPHQLMELDLQSGNSTQCPGLSGQQITKLALPNQMPQDGMMLYFVQQSPGGMLSS